MAEGQERSLKELRDRAQKVLAADHFTALGIARTAGPDDVRKGFVEAAKSWHPDRAPAGADDLRGLFQRVFTRIELARNVLSDPTRRLRYMEEISRPAPDRSGKEAELELRKGEVLLKKNDTAGAEHHLRRALQLAPDNAEAQTALIALRTKPSSSPEELRALVGELDRLLQRERQCARAYFLRAQLKKRLDLPKEAFLDFVRAAELNPQNLDAVREVRIYKMRQERAAAPAQKDSPPAEDGVGGFFRKLFKR